MSTSVIALEQLEFGWDPANPLLRVEHLTIAAGERVFLYGPSGSGKSTLLSLLAGVVPVARGSLRVLGTDLARLTPAARDRFRADHFGIVFQMFNLVPYLSVAENVTLPCRFSARRADQTRAHGGPARAAERLLAHLDLADAARSARAVTRLSVGQQQRVAAARALIGRPEIVLADEPTSALDDDRREAFLRLLFEECATEGTALVFVSHDRRLAPLFDRALALPEINRIAPATSN